MIARLPRAGLGLLVLGAQSAVAQTNTDADAALRASIVEASNRFDVPEPWIRAVMQVESNGESGVTSPQGAMGLMQVMPETYAYLSDRYGLGGDPYERRDNVLAGSAYLRRDVYDQFGSAGFLRRLQCRTGTVSGTICPGGGFAGGVITKRYVSPRCGWRLGEALFTQRRILVSTKRSRFRRTARCCSANRRADAG